MSVEKTGRREDETTRRRDAPRERDVPSAPSGHLVFSSSRLLVFSAALAAACTSVGTDPAAVVALAFDSLPYPAVIAGDSLRNEAGVVTPLRAIAINSDGETIEGAPFSFVALDPGVTISSDGILVSADPTVASVRVVAQSGSLQSRALTLFVTAEPDSAAKDGVVDTLRYRIPDETANTTGAITIRVMDTSATPVTNARGWIVRYSAEYHGVPVLPDNATLAWFVDDAGRRSTQDTTGTDGRAARRLRVVSTGLAPPLNLETQLDSLLVTATVINRSGPLAGSPIHIVVPVRPR